MAKLLKEPAPDDALELLVRMLGLLRFAVENSGNFIEHDPDGVKTAWIEQARILVEKIDALGEK